MSDLEDDNGEHKDRHASLPLNGRVTDHTVTDGRVNVSIDQEEEKYLIYGVNDVPPVHITIVCALQQGLLSLSSQLIVSLLVAEAVCAADNNLIKAKLLSSTLLMSGVTTLAMCLLGVRLPFFQGASSEYIVPLLLVANNGGTFCSNIAPAQDDMSTSLNGSIPENITYDRIIHNVQALQGSLILAGVVHALLGMTGLIGLLLRFIGPLTIVPTMLLIFIFIAKPVITFVEVNWPIAISTIVIAVILCLYLAKHKMPIPIWTPAGGFRIIRYPLHQVFAVLISICVNWLLCGILTTTGVLTDDPNNIGFKARTDARSSIIADNPWFSIPYPGQFGTFGFDGSAFISFMIATLISVLDSIGDYYACARVCRVPAPPPHAVNRGIMIEGMCTVLSGTVGCGHATSTNGGNIGAVGVTRVASRQVFVCVGIIYVIFGLFGKISAVFITIPYPILGGAIVVLFGIFVGVIISNLEVTAMSSPRNMAILGLATFIGLLVPTWVNKVKTPVNTGCYCRYEGFEEQGSYSAIFLPRVYRTPIRIGSGMKSFDSIAAMLLGNPNLVGTILACFLDNTVPGTKEERGIAAWQVKQEDVDGFELDHHLYEEGYEVYQPWLPKRLLRMPIMKRIPFLPHTPRDDTKAESK